MYNLTCDTCEEALSLGGEASKHECVKNVNVTVVKLSMQHAKYLHYSKAKRQMQVSEDLSEIKFYNLRINVSDKFLSQSNLLR